MIELGEPRRKIKTGLPTDGLFIVVGDPKSGKTKFGASMLGSIVLECEPGGGDRVDGWIKDVTSLAEFREAIKAAVAEPKIKTIVVDTVDTLSDWLEDEVAKSKGLEKITDRRPGVDGFELWGTYRGKIECLVAYLKATGKLVVLLAHCREAKADDNGNIVTPKGINVPGKSGAFMAAQADIIGYTFKRPVGGVTQYVMTFQGGPSGNWGSRLSEVNDKTITLPEADPYSAFVALFEGAAPASNGNKTEKITTTKSAVSAGRR